MVQELIESQRIKAANAHSHPSLSTTPHPPSKINELIDFFKSIAAVLAALTGLISVIGPCWCIVRCVRNGGRFKVIDLLLAVGSYVEHSSFRKNGSIRNPYLNIVDDEKLSRVSLLRLNIQFGSVYSRSNDCTRSLGHFAD
jgi:hypothetical protein